MSAIWSLRGRKLTLARATEDGVWIASMLSMSFVISAVVVARLAAAQPLIGAEPQPCNPLIDGTYCATQGGRLRNAPTSTGAGVAPIQSLSGDLSLGQDSPATFGGISISGNNTVCIGLLRRGTCN